MDISQSGKINDGKSEKKLKNIRNESLISNNKSSSESKQNDVQFQQDIMSSKLCSHFNQNYSSASKPTNAEIFSNKRKRRSSFSIYGEKELNPNEDPPAAKRNKRMASNVASVYPSPAENLMDDIDTNSSSECLSTATDYDIQTPYSTNSFEEDIAIPSSSNSTLTLSQTSAQKTNSDSEEEEEEEEEEEISAPVHSRTPSGNKYNKNKSVQEYETQFCMTPLETEPRTCPLPALSWANAAEVWSLMCRKDELASYHRNSSMLDYHPGLQPRMRAILLDWLIEVCEVYKLHRETYFLAVDYLDRYLSTQKKVQKTHLQLIGITCLFVAAKVEEIYPPKIGEFAYVTDGACQESDIIQHELLLLQALDWNVCPVTSMGWLGVYMQLNVCNRTPKSLGGSKADKLPLSTNVHELNRNNKNIVPNSISQKEIKDLNKNDDAFIYPQFSGMEFVQTAQLLDLCSLDVGMSNFPYSVIAASAISHTFNKQTALQVSGLDWNVIEVCVRWMEPFFQVICEESEHLFLLEQDDQIKTKYGLGHICPNIVTDDSHVIQTHTTTMAMFDKAFLRLEHYKSLVSKIKQDASPAVNVNFECHEGLLTPPASSRKPITIVEDDNNIENKPLKLTKKTFL